MGSGGLAGVRGRWREWGRRLGRRVRSAAAIRTAEQREAAEQERVPGEQFDAVPVILGEPGPVAVAVVDLRVGVRRLPQQAQRELAQVLRLAPEAPRPRAVHEPAWPRPGPSSPPRASGPPGASAARRLQPRAGLTGRAGQPPGWPEACRGAHGPDRVGGRDRHSRDDPHPVVVPADRGDQQPGQRAGQQPGQRMAGPAPAGPRRLARPPR